MKSNGFVFFLILVFTGCGGLGMKPSATLEDGPTKGPVGKTFKANKKKFEACGADSISVQTGAIQKLDLRFEIDGTGKVLKAKVVNMREPDPDLYTCVTGALYKMKFPIPEDRKQRAVQYSLVLKSE